MRAKLVPVLLLVSLVTAVSYADTEVLLLTEEEAGTPENQRIVWSTDPGIRYLLEESTDLSGWISLAGFPTEAAAFAQQHAFEVEVGENKFYRVLRLDEQPPEIQALDPADGAFALGR